MASIRDYRDASHLRASRNEWGAHDKATFIPHGNGLPVRCPKCNNLMAQDFLDEARCPNCNWNFTKAQARDMYVESHQIKALQGKWDHQVLDSLSRLKTSGYVSPQMKARPISSTARKMASWSFGAQEELRRRAARERMVNSLRRHSPVNRL